MAAYGLYTHIASNKFRSMLLLAGLFLLIYVLVYAGALLAEVFINSNASVDYYLRAAFRDLITSAPYATVIAALWIVIAYFFHQKIIDAVTGGEDVTRQQEPRLYNLLENLCISRGIPMPKLKIVESDALNAYTGMLALESVRSTFQRVTASRTARVVGLLIIFIIATVLILVVMVVPAVRATTTMRFAV